MVPSGGLAVMVLGKSGRGVLSGARGISRGVREVVVFIFVVVAVANALSLLFSMVGFVFVGSDDDNDDDGGACGTGGGL